MDERPYWLRAWKIVGVVLVLVVGIVASCDSVQTKWAFDAGMCRGTLQGNNGSYWVKCR